MADTALNGGFRKNPLICSLLDPSKCNFSDFFSLSTISLMQSLLQSEDFYRLIFLLLLAFKSLLTNFD